METPEVLELSSSTSSRAQEDALGQAFHGSYRRLVVQVYGVVGDLGEAEDLVQEAFVRAAASGRRFASLDNPEAWLRTVALNLHRNRWRKLRNFGRVQPRLVATPDPPTLEDHVAVIEALRALPEPQREVVALHHLADLPVAEIAALLGVPAGTVKSRLGRGRVALAELLGEEVSP